MKGDKYCVICNAWLGNYITGEAPEGAASYYSIIKRKYCPVCKKWKRNLDYRFYCAEYHKRKKKQNKERDEKLVILTNENKELKQLLSQLREENERLKGDCI